MTNPETGSFRRLVAVTAATALPLGVGAAFLSSGESSATIEQGVAAGSQYEDFVISPFCLDGPVNIAVTNTGDVSQEFTVSTDRTTLSQEVVSQDTFLFPTGYIELEDGVIVSGSVISSLGSSAMFSIDDNCKFVDQTTTTTEAPTTTIKPGQEVCPETIDGPEDVKFDDLEGLEFAIPVKEGYFVDGYCVKAGQEVKYVDFEGHPLTETAVSPNGKDISHVTVDYEKKPDDTTTTSTPVPPTTSTPVPPTTLAPVPPTTLAPVPPTTLAPVPPTTLAPVPPTTLAPVPPTTPPQTPNTVTPPQTP